MGFEYIIKKAMEDSTRASPIKLPKISVVGVGGAGCNIVSTVYECGFHKYGNLIAINTDLASLERTNVSTKILIGKKLRNGGVGCDLEIGERCAMEPSAYSAIRKYLEGSDLTFVIAGLGGGTGGGAGPVIAQIAREVKSMVVSIVTMPFSVEGSDRKNLAIRSLERFREVSNTVIVLENDVILKCFGNKRIEEAFKRMNIFIANMMLKIIDVIQRPSMINIDYADLKNIIKDGGIATVINGKGRTTSLTEVILNTFNNPLLDVDYRTAKAALIHITAGNNLTIGMINTIVWKIREELERCENIKIGTSIVSDYDDMIEITAILTGLHTSYLKTYREDALGSIALATTGLRSDLYCTEPSEKFGISFIT